MEKITIDGQTLDLEKIVAVSCNGVKVEISPKAKEKVRRCRQLVEDFVNEKKVIYGLTTGFGALGSKWLPPDDTVELQTNLIKSHSSAVGNPLRKDIVRAMMLLRANSLARGNSGIRLETLETLVEMINKGVHPVIPEKGSVGASGDLAPLSHMTLVLIGDKEGKAEYNGETLSGDQAMERAGIKAVHLQSKEGLALNNGSQLMTAIGSIVLYEAEILVKTAEIAASMSLEALCGISDAFDTRIHEARPQIGQMTTARNIRALIDGSEVVKSSEKMIAEIMAAKSEGKDVSFRSPQDPYSLRCVPQVIGAVRDSVSHVKQILQREINSATDNPLIFPEDRQSLGGGNFHGQPVAIAMDLLGIALATLGNISERRIARLIDSSLSNGLPGFLIPRDVKEGLHNGFMIAQYTAASLASENKVLAHPASVDSIPTCANFEDFVSMGTTAARKATEILKNVRYIVAIELLCAAQGIDFRGPEKIGRGTKSAFRRIREKVPQLTKDRVLSKDIEEVAQLIASNEILTTVEKAIGTLA